MAALLIYWKFYTEMFTEYNQNKTKIKTIYNFGHKQSYKRLHDRDLQYLLMFNGFSKLYL